MSYHGDFTLGSTFDIKFTTIDAGIPTTLSGTPVVSAYVDNDTTQLTAGITLSADFDNVTGLNNVRVVATSGNGYATGKNYTLVITTGTVGGKSAVGYVVGAFSIENRSTVAIDDFLDTEVAAIKAKTDSLTFTVAGQVDANIQSVNDTALTGDGSTTPWGPA